MAINKNTSMGKTRAVMQNESPSASNDQAVDSSAVDNENPSDEEEDLIDVPGEN
jgi:hypothetical protein